MWMTGESMVQFLTGLWGTIGPGVIAGIIIVIWDIVRILMQSKWLVKKLNQPPQCPHCEAMRKQIDSIAKKLGVDNGGYSGSN